MTSQRMAGQDLFLMMRQKAQQDLQENLRHRSIINRQRERDVAAAKGQIMPFTKADII